jgi:hypothetical protein
MLESFPEFLYPDRPHPNLCIDEWMNHIERQVKLDELEKIHQEHAKMSKWAAKECSEFFNLGDSHPNRKAYALLTEYIISNISKF